MRLNTLGAIPLGEGFCSFRVWAPRAEHVAVHLVAPEEKLVPLQKGEAGYFHGVLEAVAPGARYFYRLDEAEERPDPASRFQPEGVHGPSQVTATGFSWEDQSWCGLDLRDYVIYELHVGTFTPAGDFAAIIPHLEELAELGITALELMPVAQFPGNRNWGYDGVYPFAVQNSYGGPEEFKRLVNACHRPRGPWEKVLDSAEARWLGPGSPAPPGLQAAGEVSLILAPQSIVLFARHGGS